MVFEIVKEPDSNLPMVVAPPDNTKEFPLVVAEYRIDILTQLKQYGLLLFRGFACNNAESFSKAIDSCALGTRCDTNDYDLPRTVLANNVYTSSELPAHVPLPLHHEKPRSKNPPHHIYFCCIKPPEYAGGTIFADAELIWLAMPQKIKDKIAEYGVLYKQFFHGKTLKYYLLKKLLNPKIIRSWSSYYKTNDKKKIEDILINNNTNWRWENNNNDLVLLNHLPGVLTHPNTNKKLWFNSSAYLNFYNNLAYHNLKNLPFYERAASQYLIEKDCFYSVCHYGNGDAFTADEIKAINCVIQAHSFILNWQKGDFMIVDNFTFMHGKQPHKGERLLYSCMTIGH